MMRSSIMALCKPSLPRDGDPFLGDTAPARLKPLRLGTALEGKTLLNTTNSLLSLPSTVWELILDYLANNKETLANLALANSRCNLLAKSVQFCSIHLTYSDNALELLTFLAEGALYRYEEEREGHHPNPTLGAFIREIVVRTNPDHIAARHKFGTCLHTDPVYGLDSVELADRIQAGNDFYFEDYIGCISHVVEMGAVPNLFTFDWRDRVAIPETLIQSLLRSPAKELKMGGFVNLLVPISQQDGPAHSIGLRSLTLHGVKEPDPDSDSESPHYGHLITLAAPTLETLCFARTPKTSCERLFPDIAAQPTFPRLRVLMLGAPLCKTSATTLLSSSLNTLIIDGIGILSYRQGGHLDGIGHIPTLRTLICRRKMQGGSSTIPAFLSRNPQLTKLVLRTSHLESILLVLAERLRGLTSLSLLITQTSNLTPRHMTLLSQLYSLEQLHLSLNPEGELTVYDQPLLRESLSQVPNLRKLAFSQDTYPRVGRCGASWPVSRYYNTDGDRNQEELDLARSRAHLDPEGFVYDTLPNRGLFELAHRNRMLDLAEYYGRSLMKLEFMYIGQRAISVCGIVGDGGDGDGDENSDMDGHWAVRERRKTMATPLTVKREELLTYIHNTWGHHAETWGWDY